MIARYLEMTRFSASFASWGTRMPSSAFFWYEMIFGIY
jgi:hypothetical protein